MVRNLHSATLRCGLMFMLLVQAVGPTLCFGGNVDVSTIPSRDGVQLTIYNAEDLTLVREMRTITVKRGLNPLQFSWENTLIDPSSVDLKFADPQDGLDLIETSYPHDRPQLLQWQVQSEFDGAATVEISYFTSGISWAADYVCVSDEAEESMSFDGFVRIINDSGEDYADAEVRLVVGTINLVELIADLADQGIVLQVQSDQWRLSDVNGGVDKLYLGAELKSVMERGGGFGGGGGGGVFRDDEKAIQKEGLSEYFIYSIEGTETVPSGWSKRMRLFDGKESPFKVQYRYRPMEYGDQLVRMFLLRNDQASKLGTTPLPDGMVRVFRENGRDGLSLLTQQLIDYVPIGQEIEINLGPDPSIEDRTILRSTRRVGFWFQRDADQQFFNPAQGDRIEAGYSIAGWDDVQEFTRRIVNHRDKPVVAEFRLSYTGDVEFSSDLGAALHDVHTAQFTATIAPSSTSDLTYSLTTHQGYNSHQDRLVIVNGAPGQNR